MAGSPFRRRPAATRTYGSARPSAAPAPSSSDATSLNPRRTSAHAPKGTQPYLDDSTDSSSDEAEAVAASLGVRTSRPPPSPAPAPAHAAASTEGGNDAAPSQDGAASAQQAGGELETVAVSRPARKARSLGAAAAQPEHAASAGGSVVWDETAALATKPAPRRRASVRLAQGADAADAAVEVNGERIISPVKRRSLAPVAADDAPVDSGSPNGEPAPPKKRARRSAPLPSRATAAAKRDLEDDVPAPLDYVPLAERLKRATLDSGPPQPGAAAPRMRRTRSTSRAVGTASPPPPPPAAPTPATAPAAPPRPASPLRRTSAAAPLPRPASPLRRTTSSSSTRPAAPALAAVPARPATKARPQPPAQTAPRPPSPAKDLSAIFSRFAPAVADQGSSVTGEAGARAAVRAAGSMKPRMMLKRGATTGSAAVGEAGDKGAAVAGPDDEDDDHAGDAPASPTRRALERMHSGPTFTSSSLASPTRVAALGASLSFPNLGSPSRAGAASPNPFAREASPSPARAAAGVAVAAARASAGPALGSAYRPLSFAPPATTAFASAAGPTRTYAGGARTLRRDVDEEALFAAPAAHPSSSAASSSASTSTSALPKLPPALSRRTRPAGGHAAPAQQQDLSTLRALWGIDAEDALADSEEADSQDRGARVVGGGLLRKQGEGKRWMDEMGWCLEGLRDGEKSAARASALDLLNKLLSRDWLRRLKSSGQAETVYLAFRLASFPAPSLSVSPEHDDAPGPDRILDTAFAVLLTLLVRDQRMAEPLFRLRAADVAREAAKRRAPQGPDDDGLPPQGPAPTVPQSDGAGPLRSEASAGWWSSSPRKAGRAGGAEDEVDEDRCDLLEVLRELGEREWASETIGTARREGEAGGAAKGKGKKALRGDARHLQTLRDIIDSADLFPSSDETAAVSSPVTLQALALAATRSISSFTPRAIFQPQHMLCESGVFGQVVQVFVDECAAIPDRVTKYEKGLDLLPPPVDSAVGSTISLSSLSTCLSIFESTSLATPYAFHLISSSNVLPQLAAALEDLTLFTFLLALDSPPSSTDSPADPTRTEALGALTAVLGILFGLTTESAWGVPLVADGDKLLRTLLCVVLGCRRAAAPLQPSVPSSQIVPLASTRARAAAPPSIEGDVDLKREDEEDLGEDDESAGDHAVWDVLSLGLGVLANLAESADDDLRVRVRELRLNTSCHGNHKCSRRCQCSLAGQDEPSSTALEILAHLALDPLADSPNSVYRHSITGFLRLLLGLLVLDSPQNEELVLAALSNSPSALAPVLEALEELASLHDDQQRAMDEMALSAPLDENGDEDLVGESQRTEVDEEQLVDDDMLMGEVGGTRCGAGEQDGLPKRMRELVQRLRRRIS
ncbi:hypothetical protein JCM9279_000763 [Rhodotorula babjevae]